MGPGGRAAVWLQEAALGAEHHQTLTASSPSFLGAPLPPQADGSILAPLGIPEGAEPAGQSGAPGGSSEEPPMSEVDRGCWTEQPGLEGSGEFVQVSGFAPEKAMATQSSTLAWKIPWAEEPGGLQSMGSGRVG